MLKIMTLFVLFSFISFSQEDLANMPLQLKEASGLINLGDSLFISFNDGGNKSKIYLFNKAGKVVKAVDIKDCKNQDWEAIAYNKKEGKLYIGDIGNNNNKRENFKIYIIKLADVLSKNSVDFKTIEYKLPDQKDFPPKKEDLHYDAEAMVYYNDSIYVFTKCRSEPFDGKSFVYAIPAKSGEHKAVRRTDLNFPATTWLEDSVTDATIHKGELFILTYSKIYRYKILNDKLFFQHVYRLNEFSQKEGIAVYGDYIYYCSESSILSEGKLTRLKIIP